VRAWLLCADGDDDTKTKACYGQCYDDRGCETSAALPRPLRAGGGAGVVGRPGPAESPDHPFHERQDAHGPAAASPDHPFHVKQKQDALGPAAAASPGHPFHKMHGAVKPAGEPDPGYVVYPAWGPAVH
jgi:hypothetical protein